MPTKAELETELAALREELAQMAKARADQSDPVEEATVEPDAPTSDSADTDVQAQLSDMVHELTETAENHPGLALAGVFVVGVLVGRFMGR